MSLLTLNRIRSVLEQRFDGKIDMSDYLRKSDEDRARAFLSRALAALCIKNLVAVDAETAGKAVTDGFQDCGLDAIHFDPRTDTLLLVQSKWSENGTKPIDADGAGAFVAGVRDLLLGRFERFNEKVRRKEAEVRTALYADRPIRIRLITIHSASQATAPYVARKVEDLVDEINDPVQVAKAEHFDQTGAYALITSESAPVKIKLQIGLTRWGSIDKPFLAYYGQVHVTEIAEWWKEYANFLFSQKRGYFITILT